MTTPKVIKTYPPEVEACRAQWFALLDEIAQRSHAKVKAIPRYTPKAEWVRQVKQIRAEFIYESQPINAELAHLENFATISIVVESPGDGKP